MNGSLCPTSVQAFIAIVVSENEWNSSIHFILRIRPRAPNHFKCGKFTILILFIIPHSIDVKCITWSVSIRYSIPSPIINCLNVCWHNIWHFIYPTAVMFAQVNNENILFVLCLCEIFQYLIAILFVHQIRNSNFSNAKRIHWMSDPCRMAWSFCFWIASLCIFHR